MTIKPQLIALIKAHILINRVTWVKLSDADTSRISASSSLIMKACLELAGMPDSTLGTVMREFGIVDADVYTTESTEGADHEC